MGGGQIEGMVLVPRLDHASIRVPPGVVCPGRSPSSRCRDGSTPGFQLRRGEGSGVHAARSPRPGEWRAGEGCRGMGGEATARDRRAVRDADVRQGPRPAGEAGIRGHPRGEGRPRRPGDPQGGGNLLRRLARRPEDGPDRLPAQPQGRRPPSRVPRPEFRRQSWSRSRSVGPPGPRVDGERSAARDRGEPSDREIARVRGVAMAARKGHRSRICRRDRLLRRCRPGL